MDRNQLIGFVLIFFILIGWSIMTAPTQEEIEAAQEKERIALEERQNEQTATAVSELTDQSSTIDTTTKSTLPATSAQFGVFGEAATGKEQTTILSNGLVEVALSSKGGKIKYAELKEHFKFLSQPGEEESKIPVRLFEDEKNRFNYRIELRDRTINTEDLYFSTRKDNNKVTFRATASEGGYIEQVYELQDNSYNIEYDVNVVGLGNFLRNESSVKLEIDNYIDPIEQNIEFERIYSTVYFKEKDEDKDYCTCRGDDEASIDGKPVEWVSFVNQFFNTSLVAKGASFDGMDATIVAMEKGESDLKKISTAMMLPIDGRNTESFDMTLFMGPNEYKDLVVFDNDLEEIIPFGSTIFGDINRHFIRPFFDWLSKFVSSKGIVIILLIFIIKMAVYPLTYKMLHSQAKMGALKPQLAGLKDKYKGDAQKVQMETMKIYREYGVSPLGGCLPMIAQIPIWYALFRFFPASITFRQEPFLWAHDLSSYDVLMNLPFNIPVIGAHLSLFTVLYAISQVIYTYYNSKHMDMSANPAMKYVQYLMPLMFFGFFNSYASGLTCYMLFSNLFTIAQTIITKKFVFNDEKILAELNIQKAKPKKKGSFQTKLAEAMERQQKKQKQQEELKKKKKK